ncbi:FAD-binding oxidoreductase [Sphingorhabdus sp. SMR4y]|uniref:FAD-binding oxidoreductase n=1 Tax=Sphingorhabdus sp. SMR4y TaxID=2584094 RepID=UPI000B5C353F|nr:FAD-binding oxidoreductase [Sphingorhabdus sp. SMR4y]ASK89344.1 putative FAD-linked oxidoreductase [Sphingorhabdus sp. SMR4y]
MTSSNKQTDLIEKLESLLGEQGLVTGAENLQYYANDVYRSGGQPLAVAKPISTEQVQDAVRLCADAGVAMVPRGGGASYTDGYLYPDGGHVLFDLGALDDIRIDAANLLVTVGAGASWAKLKEALDAQKLRTPFWGPFSGLAATVGGSMSQNTVSHGSAAHGVSAHSALSMDVVLANGELISTSAAGSTRNYGPDLTGLFTGDCGAFGLKTAITLPLIRTLDHCEPLSFAFDDFSSYHAAVRIAQAERLDDSHFGLDLALSQGQIGRQEGFAARLKIAAEVMRKAPRKLQGLAQLMRMAVAGEDPMRSGAYMCHFIVEGFDPADAAAKARRLRHLLAGVGREIANSIPTFVRAMPFAPLTNILGPGGERWVPVHGILNHDTVVAFNTAFHALVKDQQSEMDRLGVWLGTMFSPAGSAGFLYEIALYWPDHRSDYHRQTLGEEHLATIPDFLENAEAREYANELKEAIIALFQNFGAAHFQIGRAYPYLTRLDPRALSLVRSVKQELDPKGLMNPGALGL